VAVYVSAAGQVHARRWTFRQSRRSAVSAQTRRALIVSEGLHEAAGADVAALLDRIEGAYQALGLSTSGRCILRATAPRWPDAVED
jgi:DNA/RNA-binding domain of Phe-tRNA-synthetase-like protein